MKKFIKVNLYITILLVTVLACKDQSTIPALERGVNARVLFTYPENSYLNFKDLSKAAMAFDVYSVNDDIDHIDFNATFKSFVTGTTSASKLAITLTSASFKNGKAEKITLTASELATLFAIPGGAAGLTGGDSFTFVQKVFLRDGRTFDVTNSAPSIAASGTGSFTPNFTVYVGCPSDNAKIAGNYSAIMDYNDAGEPIGTVNDVVITFKGPEPFRYSVTDHTGKLYVPYGGKEYPADFYDVCGVAVLLPAQSFGSVVNYVPAAGEIPPFGTAKIDTSVPQTVIVLNWFETFNGIKASMRFVKKP